MQTANHATAPTPTFEGRAGGGGVVDASRLAEEVGLGLPVGQPQQITVTQKRGTTAKQEGERPWHTPASGPAPS